MSVIGKSEAMKLAIKNAAAIIEAHDIEEFFGDHIHGQIYSQDGLEDILDQAKKAVVSRIEKLLRGGT